MATRSAQRRTRVVVGLPWHCCLRPRCRGATLLRVLDRVECELLVDLAGQAADADRADAAVVLEDGDAAEEEREERVEARPLGRIGTSLLGELAGRGRVAAGGRVGLALGVEASVRCG